ncbi:hypothetical protein NM208_g2649 [Fusarium decemcellulare]|uniref:Uncharacterized protein n=1 Tax=Fusarium decemcellulare TaxID=57161 RepID=A0ACC1SS95_9HYPO|nr:hypothetical protein NM208_g2649 [Fusarium decemcellulare]
MQRSRTRPDPVSCQSCRTKKLRCNRVQPCSNCTARSLTCNFLVPPRQFERSTTTSDIIQRIERLESIVLTSQLRAASAPTPAPEDTLAVEDHRTRDRDLERLENIGMREDSLMSALSEGLTIDINTPQDIFQRETGLNYPTRFLRFGEDTTNTVIFPVYSAAALLLQSYEAKVDHVCRILHIPTIRSLMKALYLRISQEESVPPGRLAMFLSMFAISAFFYQPSHDSEVATTEHEAVTLSKFWAKCALDILDQSQRNASGTLEHIQACILMTYVTYHLDGFSARGRHLLTRAASIARDLRLHRLDANQGASSASQHNPRELIDLEMKRRVFWHLASTDWLHSTISGPQEGMYFIHPNHVHVRVPKNCNDEDVVFWEETATEESQPTSMAFFLYRLRLSHICREMTDTVPLDTPALMKFPYTQVEYLDKRFEDFISNLPVFFRPDDTSREKSKSLESIYPKIPITRYCIAVAAYSRRCRLHQRFLLRQSPGGRYEFSRQACLDSARQIIALYGDARRGYDSPSTATARMGIAVHYTHLALVVLVMDLCFNKGEADEDRKTELGAALQMLDDDKDASPLVLRSLNVIRGILQKHKIVLPNPANMLNHHVADTAEGIDVGQGDVLMQPAQLEGAFEYSNTPFGEFWQSAMQSETDFDTITWDNLFSAVDSRPF